MPTSTQSSSGSRTRPPGETSEARIAKALAHPLRARILQRLGERVASPGDLALELGAPLGVVAYHVRMLRDYDCVELVRTEPRRGALQRYYKAIARPNLDETQWRTLPSGLRQELSGETIPELVRAAGYRGERAGGRDGRQEAGPLHAAVTAHGRGRAGQAGAAGRRGRVRAAARAGGDAGGRGALGDGSRVSRAGARRGAGGRGRRE